jgi:glutamate racemase
MVGFYDSGKGGKTIVDEVLALDSTFKYLYYEDSHAFPLGDKSIDYIQSTVKKACTHLFSQGCNLVILACNTASVNSIRHIQQAWLPATFPSKQVLSVTKPLIEYVESVSNALSKSSPSLILSTSGTHSSGFYQYEFIKLGYKNIRSLPCIGLADAIESGDSELIQSTLGGITDTASIDSTNIENIILACTHYTLAIEHIQNIYPQATILDPKQHIARKIIEYIDRHPEYQN